MKVESLERVLRQHPFLQDLGDEHVKFVVGCAKNVRFEPEEFIFREGSPSDVVYLVREGAVALEMDIPPRGAVEIESVGEGEVLGWSWLFPPYKHHVDARAVEPVRAIAIDAACVRKKMKAEPVFGYAFAMLVLSDMHQRLQRGRIQRLDVYKSEA